MVLTVGPGPVLPPGGVLVGAAGSGDLRPGRPGFQGVMYLGRVPVVAGNDLAERKQLQALINGERRVLGRVWVTDRVIVPLAFSFAIARAVTSRPVSSSNRSQAL